MSDEESWWGVSAASGREVRDYPLAFTARGGIDPADPVGHAGTGHRRGLTNRSRFIPDELRGADTRDPERLRRRREITLALREQGWSWRRIADEMGVSVSTAKHRARRGHRDDG